MTILTATLNATFDKDSNASTLWKGKQVNVRIHSNQIEAQGNLPIDDLKSLINKLVLNIAFGADEFYEVMEFKY